MVVKRNKNGLFVATVSDRDGNLCAGFSKDRIQAMIFCFELLVEG